MLSSNGSASPAPMPRKTVLREIAFLVTNMARISLFATVYSKLRKFIHLEAAGTISNVLDRGAELIQKREVHVGQGRFRRVLEMAATLHLTPRATHQHQRQIDGRMQLAIAHAGAVDGEWMVQQ